VPAALKQKTFELRTNAWVTRVLHDKAAKWAATQMSITSSGGAMAYRTADPIKQRYLKNPGMLV
jgi:hypothetical protein